MKVSVNCSVTYSYEVDLPTKQDMLSYVDDRDPVYFDICKVLTAKGLNYDGVINSIVDEETDAVLYAL